MTFDGGARVIHGRHVAAGAAIWWAHDDVGLLRPAEVRWRLIPAGSDSVYAEAWGGALAAQLALDRRAGSGWTQVIGDNIGIVRYAGDEGRSQRHDVHDVMDPVLTRVAGTGLRLGWEAVRRRHNVAADAAELWAGSLPTQLPAL